MHHLVEIAIATDVQLDWLGTGQGIPETDCSIPAIKVDFMLDSLDRDLIEVIATLPSQLKLAILKLAKAMVTTIDSA